MLQPGSSDLDMARLRDTTQVQQLFTRAKSDTVETLRARLTTWLRIESAEVSAGFAFSGIAASVDTIWFRRSDLAPLRERLRARGQYFSIQYDGKHVVHTRQRGDSAAVTDTQELAVAPFGFNQLETIIQLIPYRSGYSAILPLYSEIDAAVEYDTVTVLGPSDARADRVNVRFADPAIVSLYTIDRASGQIVGHVTTSRRNGTLLRFEPVM